MWSTGDVFVVIILLLLLLLLFLKGQIVIVSLCVKANIAFEHELALNPIIMKALIG